MKEAAARVHVSVPARGTPAWEYRPGPPDTAMPAASPVPADVRRLIRPRPFHADRLAAGRRCPSLFLWGGASSGRGRPARSGPEVRGRRPD